MGSDALVEDAGGVRLSLDGEAAPAYVETDRAGAILYMNRHAQNFLGERVAAKSRRLLVSFVSPDHRHTFRQKMNSLAVDVEDVQFTVDMFDDEGRPHAVELSALRRSRDDEVVLQWRLREVRPQAQRSRRFVDLHDKLDAARSSVDMSMVLMSDEDAMDEILHRVVSMTTFMTGAAMTNVCITPNDSRGVNDNPRLAALPLAQTKFREGPSWEALHGDHLVAVDDLAVDERWPQLHRLAMKHDVHEVVALPVRFDGQTLGAITIYGSNTHAFTAGDIEILHAHSLQLAYAAVNAELYRSTADHADGLQEQMKSRAVIEQAKGMIMVREKCDEDEAFEVLKSLSQHHNVKLKELAQRIVTSGSTPTP